MITRESDKIQLGLTRIWQFLKDIDFIIIFLAIFFVYNITTDTAFNGDSKPAALLPYLIIKTHTVYFDAVYPQLAQPGSPWGTATQFIFSNGHYASIFPIVTGVLVIPIYFLNPGFFNVTIVDPKALALLSKFSATILVTIAGTVFYLLCKKLFSLKLALISTIIFAFGTLTWAIGSQTLWQHGTSELLLTIAIFCIVRNESKPSIVNFEILGIVSGLFLFNRPSDALLLIPVLYYVYLNREQIMVVLSGFVVSGFPFFWYNMITFGNIFGGYGETPLSNVMLGLKTPVIVLTNFFGQFLSANRGLFIFSPILLFGIWGYYVIYKNDSIQKNIKSVLLLFLPFIMGTIFIYSAFPDWGGGWSYGPRYMTGFLPVLAIYTGYGISSFISPNKNTSHIKKVITVVIVILIAISIIIEAIGAWAFPYCLWETKATNEKLWDWSDSEILASYHAGAEHLDNVMVLIWPSLPPPYGYIRVYSRSVPKG